MYYRSNRRVPSTPGVSMHWLMEDAIAPGAEVSLARMVVAPGVLTEAHAHPNCTETVHLLSGTIEQRSGERCTEMRAGDTALIPRRTVHQTRNVGPEPAEMIIAYSAGTRLYEASEDAAEARTDPGNSPEFA